MLGRLGHPVSIAAMDGPPLPEPVARRARSYLEALVPAGRTSDAWHELVADVAYWGDREELPVLRLAHQVVLQHERVTDEAATLALDELGISSPRAVAAVLDVSPSDAEVLVDRVAALVAEDERPPEVRVFDAEAGAVEAHPPADEEDGPGPGDEDGTGAEEDDTGDDPTNPGPDEEATSHPPEPAGPVADAPAPEPEPEPDTAVEAPSERRDGRAVRIGFEDDDVIEVGGWDDDGGTLDARRWGAIVAIVVGAAILLWLLIG